MFRKPRSPLSRTRFKHGAAALKQADKSTSHATPVEQALAIIEGLWRVLLAILVSPGSLDRKINGDTQVQKTTPKYTFLVLSTFVAIKATKMSLTILMLAMLPFVRGCEPETQQKMVFPSIEAELILPKLEDILLMGVPSVLLVILFLRVYARILKFIAAKRTASRFYNVACYIAGWQYLASSVIIICTLRLFADTESGIGYTLEALRWGGIGALAWGTLLYTWTLLSIEKLPPWRRYLKRTAKFGLILASSAVLSALVLVAGLATAVPLAIHGSKKELIKPLLQVTLIKTERDEDMNQTLRFVLRNLSENTVYLSGGSVHFLYDPTQQASDKISSCETGIHKIGEVEEWRNAGTAGVLLEPNKNHVITVVVAPESTAPPQHCPFGDWPNNTKDIPKFIFYLLPKEYFQYPAPKHYAGRIGFNSLVLSEEDQFLEAFIINPSR
jgi:hypothetical protein